MPRSGQRSARPAAASASACAAWAIRPRSCGCRWPARSSSAGRLKPPLVPKVARQPQRPAGLQAQQLPQLGGWRPASLASVARTRALARARAPRATFTSSSATSRSWWRRSSASADRRATASGRPRDLHLLAADQHPVERHRHLRLQRSQRQVGGGRLGLDRGLRPPRSGARACHPAPAAASARPAASSLSSGDTTQPPPQPAGHGGVVGQPTGARQPARASAIARRAACAAGPWARASSSAASRVRASAASAVDGVRASKTKSVLRNMESSGWSASGRNPSRARARAAAAAVARAIDCGRGCRAL